MLHFISNCFPRFQILTTMVLPFNEGHRIHVHDLSRQGLIADLTGIRVGSGDKYRGSAPRFLKANADLIQSPIPITTLCRGRRQYCGNLAAVGGASRTINAGARRERCGCCFGCRNSVDGCGANRQWDRRGCVCDYLGWERSAWPQWLGSIPIRMEARAVRWAGRDAISGLGVSYCSGRCFILGRSF